MNITKTEKTIKRVVKDEIMSYSLSQNISLILLTHPFLLQKYAPPFWEN